MHIPTNCLRGTKRKQKDGGGGGGGRPGLDTVEGVGVAAVLRLEGDPHVHLPTATTGGAAMTDGGIAFGGRAVAPPADVWPRGGGGP